MRRVETNERGLSNSVQTALLFPVGLGLLLALLQWALITWADATAMAAAHEGAIVAASLGATAGDGQSAAIRAADSGALTQVTASVERGSRQTSATVTGNAVVVLWPQKVSHTMMVTTERLTQP